MSLAALCLALFAAAFLTPAASAAPARAGKALLPNGDFERGLSTHPWMPSSWDTSMADLPTVFFGRDSFLVHSGKWAVNVANMSAAFPMAHNWSQTILVTPDMWGKTAVFKAWTRSNGLEGRAYLVVQAYSDTATKMGRIWGVDHDEALRRLNIHKIDDPLLDLGWKRTTFDDPLTEWVEREARTVVPPGTNVLFVRCGLLGTGQVLFDDASLTLENTPASPKPAKGENLFLEPGFENRALAWDIAIPPYEGAKVETDSTVARSGRSSLLIRDFFDGLVETRIGAGQPFNGRALRGQRVRLSGYFKGDSLQGSCFVKVYSHGMRTHVTQSPGAELLSGTWDWKELAIEFDIPEDSELVWANLIALAPASGRLWIDDARFEVVGTSKTVAPAAAPMKAGKK
ncbi:MAG: hypothetical protein K8R56_07530 [Candidatus Eisenbacteria bacterium]|nr:hypothetical protein [Candidatus Eisenbacteria bacterium]